jgi:hypothetical protein
MTVVLTQASVAGKIQAMRRALAWLVAVPLMGAATMAAHALDYRLVAPDASARSTLLAATGHSYQAWLPFALAALSASAVIALARGAAELRARAHKPAVAPFLVLPSLAFLLQEHLERLLHDGAFPWHAVTDPTFAPGLALTLPFGFAAYFAARAILHVARAVALAFEPACFTSFPVVVAARPREPMLVRARVPASRHATRGPPARR